ncbi:Hypothetical protein LUCI_2387 [Lucifera butyrica]|uniref:Uncharacterized protein n=1 Tax=Lucifera butyrica TaxID=1351585 RepID=A0A498RAI7_9FIRM|nr:hypothetical protein [Lucifera butyrica]VBB07143.1 Hypothetical protein LUCI_2387 [Lucifera butyrica]
MTHVYVDEKIRHIVNQLEEQEEINSQSIYEGVIVNDEKYEFAEQSFFDDRLKIYIPTVFEDMPAEWARLKYPSEDRPQVIKTDQTGEINITLSYISNDIDEEAIPEIKDLVKMLLRKQNPSYLFVGEGVENVAEKTAAFMEFKSPTMGEPLYQYRFFLEMERSVIMGIFSCPFAVYKAWQPIARQIMQSVRVMPAVPPADPELSWKGAQANGIR